jgi:hypothetical protein
MTCGTFEGTLSSVLGACDALPPDVPGNDESEFWLMFGGQSGMKATAEQRELLAEAGELLAIFAKSAKTASEHDARK